MSSEQIKKLERKVKYLLDTKDISAPMMDAVRSLTKNKSLPREDQANAIISILEKCEDKRPIIIQETKNVPTPNAAKQIEKKSKSKIFDRKKNKKPNLKKETLDNKKDQSPTQTSYYIDTIYQTYKKHKLLKKKYLVKQGGRICFELNKRLVPSKRFLKLLRDIFLLQRECASKLLLAMNDILQDPAAESPLLFNHLKTLRLWLSTEPLSYRNNSDVQWLNSYVFEKEFTGWILGYYSLQEMSSEDREFIFKGFESCLKNIIEYKKDILSNNDSYYVRSEKERRNYEIDKKLFEIKSNLYSFLHGKGEENTILSAMLKARCDVSSLREFISIIINALIYQRFVREDEFYKRYNITAPKVSRDHWDYSKDVLQQFGKDEESLKQKKLKYFERKFESLDLIFKLLRLKQLGDSYIFTGALLQRQYANKSRNTPDDIFDSDSLYYIDCMLKYFKNVYVQIINGSTIDMRDNKNNYISTSIFAPDLFSDICSQFGEVINKFDMLKSENATQVISKAELQKILDGQITTMDSLKVIIKYIGTFFYNAASKFKELYDLHLQWEKEKKSKDQRALEAEGLKPIPFYNCTIESLPLKNSLSDRLLGKPFVGAGYSEGVYGHMMAYCYQAAQLCSNDKLKNDLYERETLISLMRPLKN